MKMNYTTLVATNLIRHKAEPGDVLTLIIRNEDTEEGIYAQAKRHYMMFVACYGFFPDAIAMHPDHLTLLQRQHKSLDVLVSEEGAKLVGDRIDLAGLPRRIPLVADEALDLFTTVARYDFKKEYVKDFATSAIEFVRNSLEL